MTVAGETMGALAFRQARLDETEVVLTLLREAAAWLRDRGIDYWQSWLDPPDTHIRRLERGCRNGEFFLVECDDEVVGCFRLQWEDRMFWGERNDKAGYVHSVTTRRDLAGTGTGRRVLEAIEHCCVGQGRDFVRLDCGAANHRLRRYYESCGFISVGETTFGGERLTLHEKRLANRTAGGDA
jgi:GNAT superfamily N-acetyltransferase